MRVVARKGPLSVRAIAGSHGVILAWDIEKAKWKSFTKDLLGFAIERIELAKGKEVERYWLRGMKRFPKKDEGMPVGSAFTLAEHPVQSFQWGDYTVKPKHVYQYRLVPVRGKPKLLALDDGAAVEVTVSAEPENDGRHGIWFNRGVAASQAYARKFGSTKPDEDEPGSEQMKWLSRGLFEAFVDFVAQAKDDTYSLRGAMYEFKYPPAVEQLKAAVDRGVDVQILYDVQSYGEDNEAAIKAARITKNCRPRDGSSAQKHNKFLVLLKNDKAVAVWTGSTNISAGGIFGHSNVGHSLKDAALARTFLEYWDLLSSDPDAKTAALSPALNAMTPTPASPPPAGVSLMFSPRAGKSLDWYASLIENATELVCLTVAFTVAPAFATALAPESDVLRYIVSDKALKNGADITQDQDSLLAVGSRFSKNEFPGWLGEYLTGFNRNNYIHDKFMLIDPLGDDPIVVTGSANFSKASMSPNDENMLVIRGDTRVADIYFGEFMRIFDHIYARYLVKRAIADNKDVTRNYLAEDASWVTRHAGTTTPKAKRRLAFRG